jgi:hypothetical protein
MDHEGGTATKGPAGRCCRVAVVPRGHKEDADGGQGGGHCRLQLQKAGGSRGGGRYIKRGAAQQAAVTETGRLSRRPLQKAGGRYRNNALGRMPQHYGGILYYKYYTIPAAPELGAFPIY